MSSFAVSFPVSFPVSYKVGRPLLPDRAAEPVGGNKILLAGTGSFILAGDTMTPVIDRKLPAESGSFAMSGQAATLTKSSSAALSIDGSAHNVGSGSTTSVTLSTTLSNNIIVVIAESNGGGSGITSVVGSTLGAFTKRGGPIGLEIWWKLAASPLTNEVITVTPNNAAFDSVTAFGVNGANTTSPFDTNGSLPATATGTPSDPISVSTTANDTLILGGFRMTGSAPSPTAGSGFTALQLNGDYLLTEYKIVSSPQTSLSVTIGTGVGQSNGGVADAIRAA